jgi:hypothetical protein
MRAAVYARVSTFDRKAANHGGSIDWPNLMTLIEELQALTMTQASGRRSCFVGKDGRYAAAALLRGRNKGEGDAGADRHPRTVLVERRNRAPD